MSRRTPVEVVELARLSAPAEVEDPPAGHPRSWIIGRRDALPATWHLFDQVTARRARRRDLVVTAWWSLPLLVLACSGMAWLAAITPATSITAAILAALGGVAAVSGPMWWVLRRWAQVLRQGGHTPLAWSMMPGFIGVWLAVVPAPLLRGLCRMVGDGGLAAELVTQLVTAVVTITVFVIAGGWRWPPLSGAPDREVERNSYGCAVSTVVAAGFGAGAAFDYLIHYWPTQADVGSLALVTVTGLLTPWIYLDMLYSTPLGWKLRGVVLTRRIPVQGVLLALWATAPHTGIGWQWAACALAGLYCAGMALTRGAVLARLTC